MQARQSHQPKSGSRAGGKKVVKPLMELTAPLPWAHRI